MWATEIGKANMPCYQPTQVLTSELVWPLSGDLQPAQDGANASDMLGEAQQAQHAQASSSVAQQAGHALTSEAQQAQQGMPAGGVLRKPKPVGIGHMCRAISTLTGGIAFIMSRCCNIPTDIEVRGAWVSTCNSLQISSAYCICTHCKGCC